MRRGYLKGTKEKESCYRKKKRKKKTIRTNEKRKGKGGFLSERPSLDFQGDLEKKGTAAMCMGKKREQIRLLLFHEYFPVFGQLNEKEKKERTLREVIQRRGVDRNSRGEGFQDRSLPSIRRCVREGKRGRRL